MSDSEQTPLVSAIIPVFNGASHLARAVESALAQTYAPLEVLVVDDGSTDDSLAVAQELAERHPDRLRVLQHPGGRNRGVSASRNLAIEHAQGTFVAFLDADDEWFPSKIESQLSFMLAHPELGLSFTKAEIVRDDDAADFIAGYDELGHAPPADRREAVIAVLGMSLNYIFSTVMVRRAALLRVGAFPEGLPFQSEDRLLVAKVSAGHDLGFVPEVLCRYHAHGANYSVNAVRDGMIPMVFFNMRVHMVQWLSRQGGKPKLAREIAHMMLPDNVVPALRAAKSPQLRRIVLKDMLHAAGTVPAVAPRMLWACIVHSRIGAWLRGAGR